LTNNYPAILLYNVPSSVKLACLLGVGSGNSALYHPNGRFRVHTGRSATTFQNPKSERLLSPEAVVQTAGKLLI
jgi:hypothetical protein